MFDDSVITSLFPDEVVTRALVWDVELPYGAGTMALITLDNGHDHTRPNTFGPAGLIALRGALEEIARRAAPEAGAQRIAAVGVTGKPFIFAAGADLAVPALIRSRDEALAVGQLGHDVFRRLGELGVPSFAFVNGAALGGGLELALHCTYRTISSGVTAVAFPETFLGLLPGWGGTYLHRDVRDPPRCPWGKIFVGGASCRRLRPRDDDSVRRVVHFSGRSGQEFLVLHGKGGRHCHCHQRGRRPVFLAVEETQGAASIPRLAFSLTSSKRTPGTCSTITVRRLTT